MFLHCLVEPLNKSLDFLPLKWILTLVVPLLPIATLRTPVPPWPEQGPANRSAREKEWSGVSAREFAKTRREGRGPLLKFLLTQDVLARLGLVRLLISNRSARNFSAPGNLGDGTVESLDSAG